MAKRKLPSNMMRMEEASEPNQGYTLITPLDRPRKRGKNYAVIHDAPDEGADEQSAEIVPLSPRVAAELRPELPDDPMDLDEIQDLDEVQDLDDFVTRFGPETGQTKRRAPGWVGISASSVQRKMC